MGRAFPRFLLSKSTQPKSKGTFIIHTLDPAFIAEPTFNEIRQIIDIHIVEVWQQGTYYSDKAREIADKEIPNWWKYSGIHDSCDPRDQVISKLSKLDFLRNVREHFTVEEAQQVIRIIFPNKAKNFYRGSTSYGIKHDFERISEMFNSDGIAKYCGNDVIKTALKLEGFKTKEEAPNSPNIFANLVEQEVKLIQSFGYYRVNHFNALETF